MNDTQEQRIMSQRLDVAINDWNLTDIEPMTGGNVAAVVSCRYEEQPAVLKVNPPDHHYIEAAALQQWSRQLLAPQVLKTNDREQTILMERILPGGNLWDHAVDDNITLIASLAKQAHQTPAPSDIPSLMETERIQVWQRYLANRPAELSLLHQLVATTTDECLLHMDLHEGNILQSGNTFMLIDPKPCLGDPASEIVPLMTGVQLKHDHTRAGIEDRVRRFADGIGAPLDRVRVWLRVATRAEWNRVTHDRSDVGWLVDLAPVMEAMQGYSLS